MVINLLIKHWKQEQLFAVVDDPEIPEKEGVIKVENSLATLQELAKMHRRKLNAKNYRHNWF